MALHATSPPGPPPQRLGTAAETSSWFTPGRFALLFALLVCVGWPQVLIGWETFYLGDYATFGYPLAFQHRTSFWNGELPLWDPLNNCGTPFLAQWNTLTLYPLSLIYLCLPLPWSLAVYCLAHLFFAGVGMYFLAWRWTHHRLAAALAGVLFGFNGLTWFGLMWPNNIAALGWMPWVILTVERGWRDGRGSLLLGSIVAATQILAGAPEVAFQTWIIIGALWVLLMLKGELPRLTLLTRGLGLGLLTTGLTAAQMLPFLDLLTHSQRNTSYGDPGIMAMPLWGWFNYVVPLFHMIKTRPGMYLQPDQAWTASYYLAIATLALAFFAIARRGGPRTWLLAALALFSLLMCIGAPGRVYSWVSALAPQMNFMRFPIKFIVLATFALPLLAGLGAARWFERHPTTHDWRWLGAFAAGILALIVGLVLYAHASPISGENPATTFWNGIVRAIFLVAFLGFLVLLQRERDTRLHRVWQTALVLTLWFDVYTHSANLSPTVPSRVLAPGIIREFFGWENELYPGQSRALQGRSSFWRMLADSSPDAEVDVHGRRLSLFFNLNLLDAVPKFDGFFSLETRHFSDVFREVYFGSRNSEPVKRFLGISHVSNPTNSVDWVKQEGYLPLVTAGQAPQFAADAQVMDWIFDPAFDPGVTVYLPPESRSVIEATGGTAAQVTPTEFSAHHLRARVSAAAPALVVIAQAYYHPWKAYIDGRPAPLHRANYAFQAVQVPAGNHELVLRYEDRAFRVGAGLSGLSLALCAGLAVWFRRPASTRR